VFWNIEFLSFSSVSLNFSLVSLFFFRFISLKKAKIPIFYFIMIKGNKIKYKKKVIKNGKKRFGNFFGIGHF